MDLFCHCYNNKHGATFLLFLSANEIQTLILVRYFQNLEFQIINLCDTDDACAVRIERERELPLLLFLFTQPFRSHKEREGIFLSLHI